MEGADGREHIVSMYVSSNIVMVLYMGRREYNFNICSDSNNVLISYWALHMNVCNGSNIGTSGSNVQD